MKRLCSGPGCGRAIAVEGPRYCAACLAERGATSVDAIKSNTVGDRVRYAFLYTGDRWKRVVQPKAMKKYPMCARCDVALSVLIDHIVPSGEAIRQAQAAKYSVFDKYAGFYFMSNLQGLCAKCHSAKTTEDTQHVGPWPDVVAKERAQPKKVYSF